MLAAGIGSLAKPKLGDSCNGFALQQEISGRADLRAHRSDAMLRLEHFPTK
jgi:hypothetical protein